MEGQIREKSSSWAKTDLRCKGKCFLTKEKNDVKEDGANAYVFILLLQPVYLLRADLPGLSYRRR